MRPIAISRTPSDAPSRFVVVGRPDGRRVALLQAALRRAGLPRARVVSYLDLLEGYGRVSLGGAGVVVRPESTERDPAVERGLVALGAERESMGAREVARLRNGTVEPGRIHHPRLWAIGFRTLLARLQTLLDAEPPALVTNAPAEIATMFDKAACQERFARAGIPAPRPFGLVAGYDELRERLSAAGRRRAFVKLASGSSASGIVAYETNGRREQAWTTVELARADGEVRLYNSRRVRRYEDRGDIGAIVDALGAEGAVAEAWVPKASLRGRTIDLRIVVIGGRASHAVPRVSRSPFTNLHLGNERGDLGALVRSMGDEAWSAVRVTCERAAGLFPQSLHVGVDVALTHGFRSHFVLEVNAFGDLLPGVLEGGRETYDLEIEAAVARSAPRLVTSE